MRYGDLSGVYHALRRDVTTLVQFVRTLQQQVGTQACMQARPDYDHWITELELSLALQCAYCGAMLPRDMLGSEAYTVGAVRRACPRCYERLQDSTRSLGRPVAPLVVHAAEHPELLAGPLVRWQYRLGLSDRLVEQRLALDTNGLLRLALSPLPDPQQCDQACQQLAATLGCAADLIIGLVAEDDPTLLDHIIASADDTTLELPF
jgi:hypothetical protein